jgi:hypothetical protein
MQAGILRITALAIACTALASCADSTKAPAGTQVSLSFTTAPAAGASFSTSAGASATSAADNVEITSAQLVVARMELQSAGASCTSEAAAGDDEHDGQNHDGQDDHDCAELNVGPTIVSLPTGSAVKATLEGTIPAGSYSALEARIRPIRADGDKGKASAAFLAANPDWAGKSLIVKGTLNGTPFTYTGTPRAEFETVFDPPLEVGAEPVNITVQVDKSKWFLDPSGAVIDPATADPVLQAQIAQNIRRSFRAFRDNDRDGHDDHDGHHHD